MHVYPPSSPSHVHLCTNADDQPGSGELVGGGQDQSRIISVLVQHHEVRLLLSVLTFNKKTKTTVFPLLWLPINFFPHFFFSFFLVVFPRSYSTKSTTSLPANYTCYRCGNAGHHIRNCPTSVRGEKKQRFPPPSAFPLAPWWPNVFDAPCLTAGQERRACPQVEEEHRHPALLHGGGGRPQHQRRHADQLRELRHPCHTRVRRIRSNSLNQCLKI